MHHQSCHSKNQCYINKLMRWMDFNLARLWLFSSRLQPSSFKPFCQFASSPHVLESLISPGSLIYLDLREKFSSCAYDQIKFICLRCLFKKPSRSCLMKLISLNLKEDSTLTSSLSCLIFSNLHTCVERGKGGHAPFLAFINEVDKPFM